MYNKTMLVRGPFTLKWGDNVLEDVEELDVSHEINSDEVETIQGNTYEMDGAYKVSAVATFLATDIATLAAVLPQHFVPNGQVLSTGETVNEANGAIDVVPQSCEDDLVKNNLDIISCGNPSKVVRIVSARTKIEGYEVDNMLQKVQVKFVGEAEQGEATMQFFTEGTIATVS